MVIAILFISSAMGAWFTYGKQYVAQASFAQAQATQTEPAVLDQAALSSFTLYPDDQFLSVRSRLALFEMNRLLGITEPSEADQQQFIAASNQALTFADAAVAQAANEPSHYAVLAAVYNNLAIAGVENAVERATTSISTAQALDPKNPTYALLTAQLAANRGDVEASRFALQQALQQKNNFAQALYLLAQIDIAEGNQEAAIATTQAIIRLEPNNPTRYYQLGILQSSAENAPAAKQAYTQAIQLDPNFANARYLLALLQIADGELDAALSGLQFIQAANPDNEELSALITTLESGEVPELATVNSEPVNENQPVLADDGVTSTVLPDSDLLTPLNTVGGDTGPQVENNAAPTPDETPQTQESTEAGDTVEENPE
jgi:tetratricopeptide (TPR) repeat protein